MVILAIETATRQGSLAVLAGDRVDARPGGTDRTHAERLPGEALALLLDRGLAIRDVDLFAIIAGPGSFTGLRVGMAAVQGMAVACRRTVLAVPTLEAMCEAWRLSTGAAGDEAVLFPCLDGQRGDVFYGAWLVAPSRPLDRRPPLLEARVGRPEELGRAIGELAGPRSVIIGDGGLRHADVLRTTGCPIEAPSVTLAEAAVRIAARQPESAVAPDRLRPVYLRRPDVVLARERAALSAR